MPAKIQGQTTRTRSFSAFVRAANPDFDLERRKEPAWEFEGGRVKRTFYQNISKFGPYVPIPPSVLVGPVASGDPRVGNTLSCTTGKWQGWDPIEYGFQWQRNNTPITNATDSHYTLLEADYGAIIKCVVTADNVATGVVTATSNSIGPVYELIPVNITPPVISGTAQVGQTLSATPGTWEESPSDITYTYQWTLTPISDTPVPVNTAAPVISGTAKVGQTLSATDGTWTSEYPINHSYQWKRT